MKSLGWSSVQRSKTVFPPRICVFYRLCFLPAKQTHSGYQWDISVTYHDNTCLLEGRRLLTQVELCHTSMGWNIQNKFPLTQSTVAQTAPKRSHSVLGCISTNQDASLPMETVIQNCQQEGNRTVFFSKLNWSTLGDAPLAKLPHHTESFDRSPCQLEHDTKLFLEHLQGWRLLHLGSPFSGLTLSMKEFFLSYFRPRLQG